MSRLFADPGNSLTLLTRLARRRPEAARWLAAALSRDLGRLSFVALDVALETGDPIGTILARLATESASPELLATLAERCDGDPYRNSVLLMELALAVTDHRASSLRAAAAWHYVASSARRNRRPTSRSSPGTSTPSAWSSSTVAVPRKPGRLSATQYVSSSLTRAGNRSASAIGSSSSKNGIEKPGG